MPMAYVLTRVPSPPRNARARRSRRRRWPRQAWRLSAELATRRRPRPSRAWPKKVT